MERRPHPGFYFLALMACLVLCVAWLAWLTLNGSKDTGPALLIAVIALLLYLGLFRVNGKERERLLKEMTRLKRLLEEYHLKNEKLGFDATQATVSQRSIEKSMHNKDKILLRMAEVLKASMQSQIRIMSDKPEKFLSQLKQNSERMFSYAKDLELLASLELPNDYVEKSAIHLDQIVEEKITENSENLKKHNNELKIQNEEEQIVLNQPPELVSELISRLIIIANAMTRNATIDFKLIAYVDAEMGESIRVTLVAKGRGLTELERQEFFTQYSEFKYQGEDYCPGLSPVVSYQISKKLGGEFTVASQINELLELMLIIPLGQQPDE